ncbi:MAG: hypothetical protein FD138_4279, partial [Planctomycetota bacterium]
MSGRLLAKAALLLAVVTGFTAVAQDQGGTEKVSAVSPATPKAATGASRVEPRKLRVLFITAEDCDKCARELERLRQPSGVFESMRASGWKIG